MTEHEKLVEELARLIWLKAGLDYTADDLCERAPDAARATLELIAARLSSPTTAMTDAARRAPAKSPKSEVWRTMLAFSPLYPEAGE